MPRQEGNIKQLKEEITNRIAVVLIYLYACKNYQTDIIQERVSAFKHLQFVNTLMDT